MCGIDRGAIACCSTAAAAAGGVTIPLGARRVLLDYPELGVWIRT